MIEIQKDIRALGEHVIDIRRSLHKIPELGMKEYETTDFIINYLERLGLEVQRGISGTGAIAYLKGIEGKKTIAYRADIDALTVEEQTGAEYCSVKKGLMHACGHDGHTAILLGFARYAAMNREKFKNNILFIFQPAEEGPGGAEPIVKAGVLDKYKVDYIFGLHIYPGIMEGKIGCRPGPMMAQTGEFDVIIKGKSAHGAMPHMGTDALIAAATAVLSLNTIVSRNINPLESAVLNIGKMVCGEIRNIIPKEAVLEGTMRAFNEETYRKVRSRLISISNNVAEAYNCTAEVEIRDMYPAVNNNENLFEVFKKALGEENLEVIKPMTIAEDFSYFQKAVPGLFFMLGSRNESLGYTNSLHSNMFNFNEAILVVGIQAFENIRLQLE